MKKTAYLFLSTILIGASCCPSTAHATLIDTLKTVGANIKNSQFGQSQTGQALIGTASALGTAASNLGQAYVNQKVGMLSTSTTAIINASRTEAITLQNNLNMQIQLIDQKLQTSIDSAERAALINTKQKYEQALVPLNQLTTKLNTNVTTLTDAQVVLSAAPGLAQQTAAALAGTAYAEASHNLLVSANNIDASLASGITSTATEWTNQMNAQAAQYNNAQQTTNVQSPQYIAPQQQQYISQPYTTQQYAPQTTQPAPASSAIRR